MYLNMDYNIHSDPFYLKINIVIDILIVQFQTKLLKCSAAFLIISHLFLTDSLISNKNAI